MKPQNILLLLVILLLFSSCNKNSEKFTIETIPQSEWNCRLESTETKKGVIGFSKDTSYIRIVNQFWPMLASESTLKFDNETYEFKIDKYLFKGKWSKKDSTSIYLIGNKALFNDTIVGKIESNGNKNYLLISESKIINLDIEDEIEIFDGENILFELNRIK